MLQKFLEIKELAKTADGKRLSELTKEQKDAVMFVCDIFPAKWENGKIRYDAKGKEVTLAYSYVQMNRILKYLDPNQKGHMGNYIHVLIDEPLPELEELPVREALILYPNATTTKQYKFNHLPPLKPEFNFNYESIYHTIGAVVAQMVVSITRNIPLTTKEDYILKAIHDNKEAFKKIMNALGLQSLTTTVLNHAPRTPRYARGMIEYKDVNSKYSYLATYIFLANQGLYLKVLKEE